MNVDDFKNFDGLIFSSKVIKILATIFYLLSLLFLFSFTSRLGSTLLLITGFIFQTLLLYSFLVFADLIKLAVQIDTKIDINNNQINNKLNNTQN